MPRGKREREGRGSRPKKKKELSATPANKSVLTVESNSQGSQEPQELQRNLEKQLEAVKNQLAKVTTEYENFRHRMLDERKKTVLYACEAMVLDLLPILDDFDRAIPHMDNSSPSSEVFEGIRMIYRRLLKVLEQRGVVKFQCVGKPFDPHFHEAVQVRDDTSGESAIVLEELSPGYLFHDRLLRPAKVVVSRSASTKSFRTPLVTAMAQSDELEEDAASVEVLEHDAGKAAAGRSVSSPEGSVDHDATASDDLTGKGLEELSVDVGGGAILDRVDQLDEEEEIPLELDLEAPSQEGGERDLRNEFAEVEKTLINTPDSEKWQFDPASFDSEELWEELTRPETEGLDEH